MIKRTIAFIALFAVLCTPAFAGHCYTRREFITSNQYIFYFVGQEVREQALADKIAQRLLEKLAEDPGVKDPPNLVDPPTSTSLLAQKCAKCHSGATPEAGLILDGRTGIGCDQITQSLRLLSGLEKSPAPMEKLLGELKPEEKAALMQELLSLEKK